MNGPPPRGTGSKGAAVLLGSLAAVRENEARFREILLVLAKYGLADWLGTARAQWLRKRLVSANGERLDACSFEQRVRLALLELGTTFVKLGQMLSTRPELVGRSLAAELSKLQSATPADQVDVVRRTIRSELGKPPEELFLHFDVEPLASASIAQVHHARLHGGEAVAVKVQHAGIEATVQRDLALLLRLAALAQKYAPALRSYRPVSTVREFRRTLLRELDLRAERRNLEEFARHFADDEGVHFPRAFPELSSRRVLTMELIEGVGGAEAAIRVDRQELPRFVRRAATMYLDMIFRDGFYHADPHPGNYVVMPGGVVGVLDCGMVGRLDDVTCDEIDGAVAAVAERDVDELTEWVVRLGSPPRDLNRDALRADLAEFVAEYGSRPIKELELGAALGEMTDIIARYHIILPADLSLLLRTLMVLEGSARELDPTFSLIDLITEYRSRAAGNWPARLLRDAKRTARQYGRLVQELPEDAADILHRIRSGRFELKHTHRGLESSVDRLVTGLLAAALLVSASLLLANGSRGRLELLLGLSLLASATVLALRLLREIGLAKRPPN